MSGVKILYILLSYVLGSILFSELSVQTFHHKSLMEISANHNPGASNAFRYGGIPCGIVAVLGDIAKGFFPVFFYDKIFGCQDLGLSLVMMVVALGHAYSLFYHFRGGMCIAVSFGIMMGLFPQVCPLVVLIVLYLSFLVFRKDSTSMVTMFVYNLLVLICAGLFFSHRLSGHMFLGIVFVSLLVCFRMWRDLTETEQKRLRRFRKK